MKTIGLIGGLSWESSVEYYRLINETVRARLGGLHSAQSLMFSFDFEEIEHLQHQGDWAGATARMVAAARQVRAGGADFVAICSNTMHKMAPALEAALDVPLLHIADATGVRIRAAGHRRIGLLGTRFTMEEAFYKGRLTERFGLEVLVPPSAGRERVHQVIYGELCAGVVQEGSRADYLAIIDELAAQGAEAVILGCTEITLLVQPQHTAVPLFDTTRIHAEACVDWALGD